MNSMRCVVPTNTKHFGSPQLETRLQYSCSQAVGHRKLFFCGSGGGGDNSNIEHCALSSFVQNQFTCFTTAGVLIRRVNNCQTFGATQPNFRAAQSLDVESIQSSLDSLIPDTIYLP